MTRTLCACRWGEEEERVSGGRLSSSYNKKKVEEEITKEKYLFIRD